MNPALDQLLVAALILGAAAFFIVRFLRKRAAGKACGGDCCARPEDEARVQGSAGVPPAGRGVSPRRTS